jgi:ATP-dependent DNA helicase DinG
MQIEHTALAFDTLNTIGMSYFIEKDSSILVRSLDEATREVFSSALHNAARETTSLIALLGELRENLPSEMEDDENVTELMLTVRSLEEIAALVPRFKTPESEPETIFWLYVDRKNPKEPIPIGTATPLEVAPLLSERLFSKIRSCVCTSATLTIDGSFRWWRERVGIPGNTSNDEKHYPSPFPYSEHAMLAIDSSAPLPDSQQYQAYLNDAVAQLLYASQGRALVLFTSYKTLHDTYAAVGPLLEKEGILVLKQGQKDRYSLLQTFVNDISSVLFATQSFWEGVDAPGETLSLVIIAKLPFRVPTDPIQASRAAAIDARGGNSFTEMSIPEAVILFKQGFGRLIRHSNDRGIVAVLDARITKKSYGKLFVSSLPHCKIETGDIHHICQSVVDFLE